jgi:hypothetical protein
VTFSASAGVVTKTFVYDGTQNSIELLLKTEKTHTEYRYENVESTCYRSEVVGYRTHCTGGGYGAPPVCWSDPIYVTVPYACIERVRISYEVKDYDVDARVLVDVRKLSDLATEGEVIKVTLDGDILSFDAIGSKKFFIVTKKKDIRSNMNGSVKFIDAFLAVELVEAAPILKAIQMTKISMKGRDLKFTIGEVVNPEALAFSLNVTEKKTFSSDRTLFNQEVERSRVKIEGTEATINLNHLGIELYSGKFALTPRIYVKLDGHILNQNQFDVGASRTLIYKIR